MKKLFSLVLACIMVISMTSTVLATTTATETDLATEMTTLTTDLEIKGEGEGIVIQKSAITKFTLPTDAAFDFFFDPMGLTAIEDGQQAKLSELNGGLIVMKAQNAAEFINKSGFDVKVTVGFEIDDTSGTSLDIETEVDVFTTLDDELAALFYVQPSTSDVKKNGSENGYAPTAKAVVVEESGTALAFAFKSADYTIDNTGGTYSATLLADSVHGNALTLGGYINPKADYTDATGVTFGVTFKIEESPLPTATGSFATVADNGIVAHGLLANTFILAEPLTAAPASLYTVSSETWAPGMGNITITVNPTGRLAGATAIKGASTMAFTSTANAATSSDLSTLQTNQYLSFTGNVITILPKMYTGVHGTSSLAFTLSFEGTNETLSVTITRASS